MSTLTVDIGNSNIVFGFFYNKKLLFTARITSTPPRTLDEYSILIRTLLKEKLTQNDKTISLKELNSSRCVISSVVPHITPPIIEALKLSLNVDPLLVEPGIKTGIMIKAKNPSSVGSDRIVNSAAVAYLYELPAIVVDCGTATCIDVVNEKKEFLGTIIAPGIETAAEALTIKAAKLPTMPLAWNPNLIGRDTIEAMQIGCINGFCYLIDGLVTQAKKLLTQTKNVVCTGGLGQIIYKHCKTITDYNPNLTLEGLRIIGELNR
ncbi:MAG: type III pantothenate kinase [Candidatus Dadabacteria bacterium]|nr:MAG: type III pantothenate kinase [Candidatus Dadabacteria bacterium]